MSDQNVDNKILDEISLINSQLQAKPGQTKIKTEQIDEFDDLELNLELDYDSDGSELESDFHLSESEDEEPEAKIPSTSYEPVEVSAFVVDKSDPYYLVKQAIFVNETISAKLKNAYKVVSRLLSECTRKKQEVDYQIRMLVQGLNSGTWKVPYSKAGYPYFKDKKGFAAPENPDTIRKRENKELAFVYERKPTVWTMRDKNIIWKQIREDAADKYVDKDLNQDLRVMFGPIGTEYDWMKISCGNFKGKHSADACRFFWNSMLHPEINKTHWTQESDKKLLKIAENNDYQDWDAIASALDERRSSYQCFIRFYKLVYFVEEKDSSWSTAENELLKKVIKRLKIGDYIPWGTVAGYLFKRSKNQVYNHWRFHLNPLVRKGRFTDEEDSLLLLGTKKYGKNFLVISNKFLPHRTSVQLNTRFQLLMLKTNQSYNSWTLEEDRRLINLHDELGPQWSIIAQIINRDRTYLRHRHAALMRHLNKKKKLIDIPRKNSSSIPIKEPVIERRSQKSSETIDKALIRFFQQRDNFSTEKITATYRNASPIDCSTEELYSLLRKLKINFNIPDNLEHLGITEEQKQKLKSLKEFIIDSKDSQIKRIEMYRRKMFGSADVNDGDRFIPPAPFITNQNDVVPGSIKRTKKRRVEDTKLELDVEMKFETPEDVNLMIEDEEQKIFGQISTLFTTECKVYQFPEGCEYNPRQNIEIDVSADEDSAIESGSSNLVDLKDKNILFSRRQTIVEPCRNTLIGYRNLLESINIANKRSTFEEGRDVNETRVTKASEKAFELLKHRLTCLFKYPIVMARSSVKSDKVENTSCVPNFVKYQENIFSDDEEGEIITAD